MRIEKRKLRTDGYRKLSSASGYEALMSYPLPFCDWVSTVVQQHFTSTWGAFHHKICHCRSGQRVNLARSCETNHWKDYRGSWEMKGRVRVSGRNHMHVMSWLTRDEYLSKHTENEVEKNIILLYTMPDVTFISIDIRIIISTLLWVLFRVIKFMCHSRGPPNESCAGTGGGYEGYARRN